MKLGYPWCAEGHPREAMRLEVGECHPTIWRCPECWATAELFEEPALDDRAMYRNERYVAVSGPFLRAQQRDWSEAVRFRFVDDDDHSLLIGMEFRPA